jgi:uncharacterized membrane protein YfcA
MEILYLSIAVFVGSLVGTTAGFGTSTVMIPVVLLFYPLSQTLLFVGIIHFLGNIWKLVLFREAIQWKLILSFGIPGIAAGFLGALLVFEIPSSVLSRILAGFIIFYVIYIFLRPDFKIKANRFSAALGGFASGFMAGVFGMGGAVRSLFLSAFNLPKEIYLVTGAAIAIVIDISRLMTYLLSGTKLEGLTMWWMLLFFSLSFIGAKTAKLIVNKIPQKYFRTVVAIFLFGMSIKLLIYSV